MQFTQFANYLEKLENTTKRLEITAILADLIKEADTDDIDKTLYLSLGYLKAPFESQRFNIAEKMMIRALEQAYSTSEITSLYEQHGDLGDVAFDLHKIKGKGLKVEEIYEKLLLVAKAEGEGSQERKVKRLVDLINSVDRLSAKYLVRIVLGTTRLGFTELTIGDALSNLLTGDKSLKKKIESKYFIHPDIGKIAKILKKDGISGLEKVSLETGVPVLAQKAQRIGGIEETIEKLKDCWAEYKFDGTRVQLHFDKNKKGESEQEGLFGTQDNYLIKTYTRNLEDSTHQHPDILEAAKVQINADSVILDGEAIGIDKDTGEFLPFQQIMQRKRKHSVKEVAKEIPLQYFVFDILYLNGENLMNLPMQKRHEIISKTIKPGEVLKTANYLRTTKVDELTDYFKKAKDMGLEGLIVKKPEDPYKAGARSYSWVKLKIADEKLLDDSIDAVVLGYYFGKGVRSKFGIGGFLIGIYDEKNNKYKTISKVGTGLKDEDWTHLKNLVDAKKVTEKPRNVDVPKEYTPDVFCLPSIVVEIGADEISVSKTHSAKYALRFPRLLFFRTDKKADQVTDLNEIKQLYSMQKLGNYKE